MSFSRPDPSSPTAVATAAFATSRKGFEQGEVRDFLRMVAAELARLQEREKYLERELRAAQRGTTNAAVALDEEVVTRLLGEEAARILSTAREAASQIKIRAEENAARTLREATDEAQRLREEAEIEASRRRQDASADAEAELQMAKQQGRDMVNEARAYRERVLGELARRREMARQQIEQLVHGRDRLLQAFERARLAAVDVMTELAPLGEPAEYVNLAPTTGPVPLMVPAKDMRAPAEPAEPPAMDEIVEEVEAEAAEDEVVAESLEDEVVEVTDETVEVADEAAIEDVVEDDGAEIEGDLDADDEAAIEEAAEVESDVVTLHPADDEVDDADEHDDRPIAPVVSLFAGEIVREANDDHPAHGDEPAEAVEADTAPSHGRSVDDLFAKLRAARAESVVERATATVVIDEPEADEAPSVDETRTDLAAIPLPDRTEELAVFRSTPEAPAVVVEHDDSAFGRRDAALTPLIVSAARKMKRVLADEQNEVLHALRSTKGTIGVDDLLPDADEHVHSYADAIADELMAAAMAGADSIHQGSAKEHKKAIEKSHAVHHAVDAIGTWMVTPLRERVARAVADTAGDRDELTAALRAIYREWKTQRIDEHLDDVARTAFGRGALVALAPGTPICWVVDPNGPACPDAEDNSLAGVVGAGDPFPTDHVCAPAHEGCRCMLQQVHQ